MTNNTTLIITENVLTIRESLFLLCIGVIGFCVLFTLCIITIEWFMRKINPRYGNDTENADEGRP